MGYRISRQASAVIDEIVRYTDRNFGDLQTADYLDGLFHSFSLIADNPRLGRSRGDDAKRFYVYRQHYVFYRLLSDHVLISDIRNARQELPPEWMSD